METFVQYINDYGYVGLSTLLMLGIVGLPVPDEWLLGFAGYLVFRGNLSLMPTILSAFIGSASGITISYIIGRTGGLFILKKFGKYIGFSESKRIRVEEWFEHIGKWALMFGYFIPGVRHFTAFVAGSSKLHFTVFSFFAYFGAFCWVVIFISAGYFFGENWMAMLKGLHGHYIIVSIIAVVLIAGFFIILEKIKSKK